MDDFVSRANQQYFDGGLPPRFLDGLRTLPTDREDVRDFVERTFRFMNSTGLRAADLSELQGEVFGSLLARILPGAWEGRVPPITVKGRHSAIDAYLADNRYLGKREHASMLDLGCGFPPETTVDTANALPGWSVHGADPSMPAVMVCDPAGSYATFDVTGEMLYCQPAAPSVENWNQMLEDPRATAARFRQIREGFPDQSSGSHTAADGSVLFVDPKSSYERPGLSFGVGGIGQIDSRELDVVRCFNVLFYFDDDFYQRALDWFAGTLAEGGILLVGCDWAFTTECRYILYQKVGASLVAREFAFSLDNVLPMGLVPFFTLHDDDRDQRLLSRFIRVLRDDAEFNSRYSAATDALRAKHDVCARGSDGYYGGVAPDREPGDLWGAVAEICEGLASQMGEHAVDVLKAGGHDARQNRIGLVCVAL